MGKGGLILQVVVVQEMEIGMIPAHLTAHQETNLLIIKRHLTKLQYTLTHLMDVEF